VSLARRAALALLASLASGTVLAEEPWPVSFGGPFALTDQNGVSRRGTDFRGAFLLVQFGYTACPDLCPLGLDTMARALDALGPAAARVQPLFITVDPARDTVTALAAFVPAFHPRLLGLTGSEAEIATVARAYRVHRRKVLPDPARPDDYLVDHGSFTYLMGPDGGFVTLFPYGTAAEAMAQTIARHLQG
jgi:protein SCO1/2